VVRLQAPQNVFTQALNTVSPGFAINLRALWEATNNRWNQWVLNYSQSKQMDLLRNLGFEAPSWEDLSYVLIALIVLASSAGALWTLWERYHQDPWLRLLHRAQARLRKAGWTVDAQDTPRQLATVLQAHASTDPHTAAIAAWLLRLEAWRYAAQAPATLAALRRECRQLPWPVRLP
jgi:hypothetical protein